MPLPRALLAFTFALLLLLPAPAARADGAIVQDEDLRLFDLHLQLQTGGNIAAAAFGMASLIAGVDAFVTEGTRGLFTGLTLTLWGAATLISSATNFERSFRSWDQVRPRLIKAGETERRLFREQQGNRLVRSSVNRAIGLVADGTSLGIGIAILAGAGRGNPTGSSLGRSLTISGAYLLLVDVYRSAVDDQIGRHWFRRNRVEDSGYFGQRSRPIAPPPTLIAAPILVGPRGQSAHGGMLGMSGLF